MPVPSTDQEDERHNSREKSIAQEIVQDKDNMLSCDCNMTRLHVSQCVDVCVFSMCAAAAALCVTAQGAQGSREKC